MEMELLYLQETDLPLDISNTTSNVDKSELIYPSLYLYPCSVLQEAKDLSMEILTIMEKPV